MTSSFGADVIRACELHEGRAWADIVEGCAASEGNPLSAEVVMASGTPVPIVAALDFSLFNRVIGLGAAAPATDEQLDEIAATYAARGQSSWSVSLSPLAEPEDLAARLVEREMARGGDFAKVIRTTDAPGEARTDLRVEAVGPEHAAGFAAVNVAAWRVPDALSHWFAGSVGRAGWRHYVAFDGDDPVSTGALFVSDGMGWLGFGATLPTHRNRGGQGAIMARRIADAAELGCEVVHTETAAETPEAPNPSYRNMIRAGFELAYLRPNFSSPPPPA
ncbi:MAG: hypothetical protein QOG85_1339 [Gaiellaceae bacterium]|nr:hypothetical protein [Gaiellaceae bacterium]